jgi:hypothetical protein
MREMRSAYKIFVEKTEGENHLEELGLEGSIILARIL